MRPTALVGDDAVQIARAFFARRFPALLRAPLVDAHVCQYENTATGDFIIDRHPQWANVWVVGGGSGHGFKHGPAVGKHVADLLAGRVPRWSRASRSPAGRSSRARDLLALAGHEARNGYGRAFAMSSSSCPSRVISAPYFAQSPARCASIAR